VAGTPPIERATEEYLTFLRVERGLAPATLRAYGSDLADFAAARGVGASWAAGPDVAHRYLAARTRRGRRNDPGLAPTSLRRDARRSAVFAASSDRERRIVSRRRWLPPSSSSSTDIRR